MCIQVVRKVIKIFDDTAILDDGRSVKTGMVGVVSIGDSLEVYGDIAIGKVDDNENNKVTKTTKLTN